MTHSSPLSLFLVSFVRAIFPSLSSTLSSSPFIPTSLVLFLFLSVAYLFLRNVTCAFRLPLSSKDGGFESPLPCLKLHVLDSRNVTDEEVRPSLSASRARHHFLVSFSPFFSSRRPSARSCLASIDQPTRIRRNRSCNWRVRVRSLRWIKRCAKQFKNIQILVTGATLFVSPKNLLSYLFI